MDWTLLIDRQAANCRNTSDEVFPRIYLGDRYEKYLYPLTFISPYLLLKKLNYRNNFYENIKNLNDSNIQHRILGTNLTLH